MRLETGWNLCKATAFVWVAGFWNCPSLAAIIDKPVLNSEAGIFLLFLSSYILLMLVKLNGTCLATWKGKLQASQECVQTPSFGNKRQRKLQIECITETK